jgi:hypothetical protein
VSHSKPNDYRITAMTPAPPGWRAWKGYTAHYYGGTEYGDVEAVNIIGWAIVDDVTADLDGVIEDTDVARVNYVRPVYVDSEGECSLLGGGFTITAPDEELSVDQSHRLTESALADSRRYAAIIKAREAEA